jgi:DNA segregation ATPase FtsK/SpoIIIE, S-DNA-T family
MVIGFITGSPFVLVFALLSPVIAVATTLDARRLARRERRTESERFDRECVAFGVAITRAHDLERLTAEARHALVPAGELEPREPVRIGSAPSPSGVAPDELLVTGDSADERRLRDLVAHARVNPALPVLVPRGRIVLHGDGIVTDALERRLAREPHVQVVRAAAAEPPASDAVTVRVITATRVEVRVPGRRVVEVRPEFVSRVELDATRAAREAATPVRPPAAVRWKTLGPGIGEGDTATSVPGGIAFGHDGRSTVFLDLERDGPHALIGGTTGSGKSEFLRALALGWAAHRGPNEVHFLFIDFKGGATFAGLTELPHAVGLVTDLDPLVAERAVHSLRAELRRRERALVNAGIRDLTQRPELLPRLVVMVDEFAALADAFPDVNAVFADISARGRSLGVHLVLCTQHPSAVVRDVVAANCAVRIAFRMGDSAGASFIATHGRDLASVPPGRAVVVTADGARAVQVATIDDEDIAAVHERWAREPSGPSPWLPPLPVVLDRAGLSSRVSVTGTPLPGRESLPSRHGAALEPLVFGLLDDPAEQRQLPAAWWPARDGSLVVIGAPRSGRSTALASLATAARESGSRPVILPSTVVEAWALLEEIAENPVENALMIADDLDVLVASSDDLAAEFVSRWDAASRAVRRVGGGVAASMAAQSVSRSMLSGRFESRLVLRCLDSDDHHLAGAPRGLFDRSAPAGRGWWADRQVQVVHDSTDALEAERVVAAGWEPPAARDSIVITRDVAGTVGRLERAYPDHAVVAELASEQSVVALRARIFVADPQSWQSAWSLLSSLRRHSPVVCTGVEPAEIRSLLGVRSTPPPIDARAGEVWVSESGGPLRRHRLSTRDPG